MNPFDVYARQLTRWLVWTLLALLGMMLLTLYFMSG
jgi:hypothetical protein